MRDAGNVPAPRVAVVGAGIAGLAAAHTLATSGARLEVVVLESSPRVGGKLLLGEVAGQAVDLGAEAMLNRRPEAVALARAVGLADDVCHPATSRAAVWTRDAVRPLPPTVMGVPTDLGALRRSGIMSRTGLARAWLERLLPRRAVAEDMSVGDFVARRFGREVVDRLVEPLLGGVYAGTSFDLSLRAAAPQIAALPQMSSVGNGHTPVFAGIRGGVGRLAEQVASASGALIRTDATVRELVRGRTWELVVGSTRDPELLTADAVVLATPAPATARLLSSVSSVAASSELQHIQYASTAVITLAVPASALPRPLTGSGFLVPPVDGRSIKAATFSSVKWRWLGEALGDGVVVMRASIGRLGEEKVLQREDAELVALAVSDLAAAVGLAGPPLDAVVTRWGGGLPQYTVGHRERVTRIRSAVALLPSLEVCGAAYDGIGVAACVADGQGAADRLLASLGTPGTMKT